MDSKGDHRTMLRLAGLQPDSIVDGPGIRLSIYVQGCSHRCPGCHNPETHDPRGGYEAGVDELIALVRRQGAAVDGVTFSGGEPFEQAAPLALLAAAIRSEGLNLVLYSGYCFEELLQKSLLDHEVRRLLEAGWLLVDGPFIREEKDLGLAYRGSKNQRLIELAPSIAGNQAVQWTGADR